MRLPHISRGRVFLLVLVLAAFAHVTFGLAFKDLWWDESLSLQRAESALGPLLRGVLMIQDGTTQVPTIDQHPFFSFLLQGALIRVAGNSEFVLRFVSAMAATLLTPALFVMGRLFVRRNLLDGSAPYFAALLAAFHPFFLWYGQEARPYALWAMLAVLCTYLLLSGVELPPDDASPPSGHRLWRLAGFALTVAMFLTTHYFAVFLLPVHALIIYIALARRSRRLALAAATALLIVGLLIGLAALWMVRRQGGGGNFPTVTLDILLPDLLNAFSLGLSVNLDKVRLLDLFFGAIALVGVYAMTRSRLLLRRGGWVPAAALITPVLVLLVGNLVQPIYMNARHMSLIAGPYILLLAAGLATLWKLWRWPAVFALLLMLGGFGYSTWNYYADETYAKDDYSRLGTYLNGRMMPGDVILYYPPSSWRIFEYYAPMEAVHAAQAQGAQIAVYGVPRLNGNEDTFDWLTQLGQQYRRIWVLKSGTHPYYDLEWSVEAWLRENFLQVRDAQFFSFSSLRAQLYLPTVPVFDELPATVEQTAGVEFGDDKTGGRVRLAGLAVDSVPPADLPLPVTLYWQAVTKPERRFKYILQLVSDRTGGRSVLGTVEREPYEGDIPTTFWDPGKTIMEYVELNLDLPPAAGERLLLTMQMYDAETQVKLPIFAAEGLTVSEDGLTVELTLKSGVLEGQ